MAHRLPLGAPGIYDGTPEAPLRTLTGVRMDVCAFVGVAPRGPARVPLIDQDWTVERQCVEEGPVLLAAPVAVQSFDEYKRLYGSFEGPGLLPYAVSSFFAQGGQRAYIVRIVHNYHGALDSLGNDLDKVGTAGGAIPGAITQSGSLAPMLVARNEGSWGNLIQATLAWNTKPLYVRGTTLDGSGNISELIVPADTVLPVGSLVRLSRLDAGGHMIRDLRFVVDVRKQGLPDRAGYVQAATLASSVVPPPAGNDLVVEIVEGALTVADGAGNVEHHDALGFSWAHPQWIAMRLCTDSQLVYADRAWASDALLPGNPTTGVDPLLSTVSAPIGQFTGGLDRYDDIRNDPTDPANNDFFDPDWVPGDDAPGVQGVHSLVMLDDLSLVVVPDLYAPAPLLPSDPLTPPPSLAGPTFAPCVPAPSVPPPAVQPVQQLTGLRLDPTLPSELASIVALQQQLVTVAEQIRSFVVLLDVPPKLKQRQMLDWRAQLSSAFAAAYHPWIAIARPDDDLGSLVRVNPSAIAAGIIARQEILYGVQNGPANAVAFEAVSVDDTVTPARHDQLHQASINVYLREVDGIRLTGARTLSGDPSYLQLSVRRLVTMLERTLYQEMQWTVFEPNNAGLRAEVRRALRGLLRQLFKANAFAGNSEDESFFIRCDEVLNNQRVIDAGQFICEVGVAPAQPLEFLVLRIVRDVDNTVAVGG